MGIHELDGDAMQTGRRESVDEQHGRMLAERARQGDTEAFGELIEQHRHRVKGWAQQITGDPHMADDIVQDALIRAFLHIGTLQDSSRFLSWLHRIVQNQANMRMRRGGPYRKERPFAAFRPAESDSSHVEWSDLDSVLFHLTRSASKAASGDDDPAEHLMRKEMYETIHALLHCLSKKERGIFEAYFFRQLSPDEIASMYQMTTGSIYTYIHRSRQKLRNEQVRASLGLLPEKGGIAMVKRKQLELPGWPLHASASISLIDRIGHMLAAIGDPRETAELMGLSGFAFRMQISDKTTFADGVYMFDWRTSVQQLLQQLGYDSTMLCGQLSDTPVPLLGAVERFPVVLPIEEAVIPFIRKYIDLGKPVLYFDTSASRPYVHEWSLIYGYDDEEKAVHLTDVLKPSGKILTYEDIANNPVRFLVAIDGKGPSSASAAPRLTGTVHMRKRRSDEAVQAIRFAIAYSKNRWGYRPMTTYLSYTTGLAAYDRWMEHLRGGPDKPPNRYGLGQLAAVYANTRGHAAQYLRTVPFEGEAMRLTLLASEAYEQAAEALAELSAAVPFVRAAAVLSAEQCEAYAQILEQAQTFEAAAIEYLEKAIHHFEKEQ
ncbi:RNA polymerase sigma factor [Paenibacillus kobensis]|uniref:RNA polymerase sigma factor n=1 Tax=Paenibacillus kobensis TaxID=59841 RepID=UPI000FD9573E|nr:RNA polymerase sigma factor [Paenibacillus kobensis]